MSKFPIVRPRRLRENPLFRKLLQENNLQLSDLIYPLFVSEKDKPQDIQSMPGIKQHTLESLEAEIEELISLKISAVLLFGIPNVKDEQGTQAYDSDNIVCKAIRLIKQKAPQILVIGDVCLCEYTSHGHCGLVQDTKIKNDESLHLLAKSALVQAQAGVDVIAPSDMMDGRIAAIRTLLDETGYEHLPILSYAVKYASAFYAPFREAAESAPQFGDRSSYQMDPANAREALKEALLDLKEGADLLMVKPGLPYLDLVKILKEKTQVPIAVYQVSGEYSMIKAASEKGWIDERRVVLESLLSMKRAGADLIISYYAKQVAHWLKEQL